ncbi:hypothetical protein [Paenibacillus mucilaginosus]|uniref:hypothetical protein n=1 Tax=Paenibacillus mucilaginosus TaxID=61624 RepID=UPI003D1A0EA1
MERRNAPVLGKRKGAPDRQRATRVKAAVVTERKPGDMSRLPIRMAAAAGMRMSTGTGAVITIKFTTSTTTTMMGMRTIIVIMAITGTATMGMTIMVTDIMDTITVCSAIITTVTMRCAKGTSGDCCSPCC